MYSLRPALSSSAFYGAGFGVLTTSSGVTFTSGTAYTYGTSASPFTVNPALSIGILDGLTVPALNISGSQSTLNNLRGNSVSGFDLCRLQRQPDSSQQRCSGQRWEFRRGGYSVGQ